MKDITMQTEPSADPERQAYGEQLGISRGRADYVVALAGNPNVGKSTVFNALTGLRQHTGNWPGKTVTRAEGYFSYSGKGYKLVDLPGTYSLLSTSTDEEVARDMLLFGNPDCTIVVVDATLLERNLNLVAQVLEITDRVVVCLNLMDEAARKGISVDAAALSRELGVPVVPASAGSGQGIDALVRTVEQVVSGKAVTAPRRLNPPAEVREALEILAPRLEGLFPRLATPRWVAMRLLDGDYTVRKAVEAGDFARIDGDGIAPDELKTIRAQAAELLDQVTALRGTLDGTFRDRMVEAIYQDAAAIAGLVVRRESRQRRSLDQAIDRLVTSRLWGLPIMAGLLALILWLTISGANVISAEIARALFWVEDAGAGLFGSWGAPAWLTGFIWHGTYRGLAWVVSVMLPPMAIFFPCFTLLEDLGYLPRVAFNLDRFFKAVGAHGKQSLCMAMGLGCNAAGIISTRIIDSPRERLIAIITNNFMPCNGRWPLLIALASIFVAVQAPAGMAALAATGALVLTVGLGLLMTLLVSGGLSRTMLKGEPSSFTLELPPYRKPNVLRILYTSIIDRTLIVLWRAVVMAAPAGAVIWLLSNIAPGGHSLTSLISGWLNPFGHAVGLDGVILLAYIIAIPANEIVIPTMLMAYMGTGMMEDPNSFDYLRQVLAGEHGWTLMTGISVMLFSLLHNPCSTTIMTIRQETKSWKWTAVATFLPLGIAFLLLFILNLIVR